MSDNPRPSAPPPPPPVAIRITRPYATEDELLEHELDTITRTGVTLLGASQRPQGVILRFELAISNGVAVLRGEGRVVGYKPNTPEALGGLTLRFTRLDSKSKGVIDKAAALRDQKRQALPPPPSSSRPPGPPPPPPPSEPSIKTEFEGTQVPEQRAGAAPALARSDFEGTQVPEQRAGAALALAQSAFEGAPVPEQRAGAAALEPDVAEVRPSPAASGPSLVAGATAARNSSIPPPPSSPAPRPPSVPPAPPASSPRPARPSAETEAAQAPERRVAAQAVASPPGRDALLDPLRARAQGLDAAQVARILQRK
jgi:hypothetical protein